MYVEVERIEQTKELLPGTGVLGQVTYSSEVLGPSGVLGGEGRVSERSLEISEGEPIETSEGEEDLGFSRAEVKSSIETSEC